MAAALIAMSGLLDPGDGPDPGGELRISPVFLLVLLGLGFLVGTLGHLIRSRTLVLIGILLIFGGTVLLPIAYRL